MTNVTKSPIAVTEHVAKRVHVRRMRIVGIRVTLCTAAILNVFVARVFAPLPVASLPLFNALPNLAPSSLVTITFRAWMTIVVVVRRMPLRLMDLHLANRNYNCKPEKSRFIYKIK